MYYDADTVQAEIRSDPLMTTTSNLSYRYLLNLLFKSPLCKLQNIIMLEKVIIFSFFQPKERVLRVLFDQTHVYAT